jgi:hypothetical protein
LQVFIQLGTERANCQSSLKFSEFEVSKFVRNEL